MKLELTTKMFLSTILVGLFFVLLMTGYRFLTLKDYNFVVEADCDPYTDNCFYRDCTAGDCPPNGYEYYKVFEIRAYDFSKCSTNSCHDECRGGEFFCKEVVCGDLDEDECGVRNKEEQSV